MRPSWFNAKSIITLPHHETEPTSAHGDVVDAGVGVSGMTMGPGCRRQGALIFPLCSLAGLLGSFVMIIEQQVGRIFVLGTRVGFHAQRVGIAAK